MRFEGYFNNKPDLENTNKKALALEGFLEDEVAKESLAEFLRSNINFNISILQLICLISLISSFKIIIY